MKYLFSIVFVCFLFFSCGKEENFIPDVPVNYNLPLQEFGIRTVNTNGILLVPNEGIAGIIIVRTPLGFVAFDRCSSVNPDARCKVVPDDTGFAATDPCSGAKFSLVDGSPAKAPAKRSLKTYSVSIQGNTTINVRN